MRRQVADGGTRVRLTRALVLLFVGSGLAFAAAQFAPPPMRLRQADPAPGEALPPAAGDTADDAGTGDAPADARNRAAERPLPADLPVALPSDI